MTTALPAGETPSTKSVTREPTRAEKPEAAAFVHVWGMCPCCGECMWILVRAQNNLLVANAGHQK